MIGNSSVLMSEHLWRVSVLWGLLPPCGPLWAPPVSPLPCPCKEPVPAEPSSLLLALHVFVDPASVSCSPHPRWSPGGLILSPCCATPMGVPCPWLLAQAGLGVGLCAHGGAHVGAIVLAEPWLLLLNKPHSGVVTEPWSHIPAWKCH